LEEPFERLNILHCYAVESIVHSVEL
jgi:hypothetical protein